MISVPSCTDNGRLFKSRSLKMKCYSTGFK